MLQEQPGGRWTSRAEGSTIAVEFAGPSLASCLASAVEGFTDAVADVHPSLVPERRRVEVDGDTAPALLLALLEECLRQGREGDVVVGIDGADIEGTVLRATLETVPREHPHVSDALPPVVSWREVSVVPDDGDDAPGWRGRLVAAR